MQSSFQKEEFNEQNEVSPQHSVSLSEAQRPKIQIS